MYIPMYLGTYADIRKQVEGHTVSHTVIALRFTLAVFLARVVNFHVEVKCGNYVCVIFARLTNGYFTVSSILVYFEYSYNLTKSAFVPK